MALVSITEAAKLVRRNRSTLYRDIERGRLSKTVTPEGETQIETSELLRTYGRLYPNDDDAAETMSREQVQIAILEERNRSLERALNLEAELRKVKDQVTSELRARLADKDSVIKVLESKVLFLEYDRQVEAEKAPPEADAPPSISPEQTAAPSIEPAPAQAVTPPAQSMVAVPAMSTPAVAPPQAKTILPQKDNRPAAPRRRSWWSRLLGRK